MSEKRSYGDRCGIARALDEIGDRWALLVVRELVLGPKRFTDLRAGLPNLTPDVLSQRLRDLEGAGILIRDQLDPPGAANVYRLTARGQQLEPVLLALAQWGSRAAFPSTERELGADSLILALKTLFSPDAAEGVEISYELRVNRQLFTARVQSGRFEVRRGASELEDGAIETDAGTLSKVLWHGRALDDAVAAGALTIAGDPAVAARFLSLFPAPVAVST